MTLASLRPRAGLRATLCAALLTAAAASALHADPVPTGKPASYPAWWFSRGVIKRQNAAVANPTWPNDYRAPQDFAALNQGQLKALAAAAYDEMEAALPGGAGATVTNLIWNWYQRDENGNFVHDPTTGARVPLPSVHEFDAVNAGQLKHVAQPFYDRLIELELCPTYPWFASFAFGQDEDFALANLGQAKNLFRFPMAWIDADDDGFPDWFMDAAGWTDALAGLPNPPAPPASAAAGTAGDETNVNLGTSGSGPNGTMIAPGMDDGKDRGAFPDGISFWTRNTGINNTSKNFAFQELVTTDPPRIRYFLVQQQLHKGNRHWNDDVPGDAASLSTMGAVSCRIDPSNLTRSYRRSESNTYAVGGTTWRTSLLETQFFALAGPHRATFTSRYDLTQHDGSLPNPDTSSHTTEDANFYFTSPLRKWNGSDFFTDDGQGVSLGSWAGARHWFSDDYDLFEPLDALPWRELDRPSQTFPDYAGDYGAIPVHTANFRTARGRDVDPDPDPKYSAYLVRALGVEYTTAAFLRDSKANQPDYEIYWNEATFGADADLAFWQLDNTEANLTTQRLRYKFHVKGTDRPQNMRWYEVFAPDAPNAQPRLAARSWPVPQDAVEHDSPVWEIAPAIRHENGHYFLLPVEVVSRDKFLAGSLELPQGWDSLEMEFVGPGGENLGKYGQLLGGGSTKVYGSVTEVLSEDDVASGGQSTTQKVWFVRDQANDRKINFYTCFNSVGGAEIRFYLNGSSTALTTISHELTEAPDFAETIDYVDAWVKGTSFYLPDATTPPVVLGSAPMALTPGAGGAISNLTRACLIPFFNVIEQVEGLSSVAVGLFNGVRSGIQDDWTFLKLIGNGGVAAGKWAWQQAAVELQKWKDSPLKRASELKRLADQACEDFVFKPLTQLGQDLRTWDGFRRRSWQVWDWVHGTGVRAWTVTKTAWSSVVNGLTDWADDFCSRMMEGSELAHWNGAPWLKDQLLAEIDRQTRMSCYTFGYTFGYLCEQVAVGALTAGTTKVAQVAAKAGINLAANLAERTAGMIAARAHFLKRILVEAVQLPADVLAAFDRGFSLAAAAPVGEGMPFVAMELMGERASAGVSRLGWREIIDKLVGGTNIRQFVKQGGEHIIEHQYGRLMHVLGDEFTAEIGENFLKIADEVVLVRKADGTVDDFFEAFFKAFEGNPAIMKHADDVAVRVGGSFEPMSDNAKATLKKFLSGPNAGKLWEIDVPAIVDDEPAVPHNYWVRGILGELSIYKKEYKAAHYIHEPNKAGFDFTGPKWVQVKTLSNPDGAFNAMRKAVDDLVLKSPADKPLKLHILKKPGSGSDLLEAQLQAYIRDPEGTVRGRVELIIQAFEIAQ